MKFEKKQNNDRKMKRKKFFFSLGLGFIGAFTAKNIVLGMLSKKVKVRKPNVIKNSRVKINPLAVSRNKAGINNG